MLIVKAGTVLVRSGRYYLYMAVTENDVDVVVQCVDVLERGRWRYQSSSVDDTINR